MQEKIECLELENGKLKLFQNKDLFCLSEDSYLLAHFALEEVRGRGPFYKKVCDLCSGIGALGLVFCLKYLQNQTEKSLSLSALEIDEASLELLELNYRQNFKNISKTILKGDLRKNYESWLKIFSSDEGQAKLNKNFDLILMNPPYYNEKRRLSPKGIYKKTAFVNQDGDLTRYFEQIRKILSPKGILCMVYPSLYLNELLEVASFSKLYPCTMQFVHPKAFSKSKLMFLSFRIGSSATELQVKEPLIVHDEDGNYMPKVRELYK